MNAVLLLQLQSLIKKDMSKKLKAYVRFDGSGRVVSSSLILQRVKPKVGNWKEIDANLCCNPDNTINTYVENDYVEDYLV